MDCHGADRQERSGLDSRVTDWQARRGPAGRGAERQDWIGAERCVVAWQAWQCREWVGRERRGWAGMARTRREGRVVVRNGKAGESGSGVVSCGMEWTGRQDR
jgi:hypothetical protein